MILCGQEGAPKDGGGLVLKKGPWTAAEDETLAAYVREYGEGNWNAVRKKTWLARCGKSCRLRWANHLRPNLRKGSFSAHEERLIIQLHSQLGNKWARMAAQLPGRTDNEIKNYWNTRLKRFQRQGLPIYPADIIPNNHQHMSSPPDSSFTFQALPPQGNYPLFTFPTPPPSLHPKRSYLSTTASSAAFLHTNFPPSSYQSTNPVYPTNSELPSNQIPYSTSLGVYEVNNLADNGNSNQNLSTDLHITTCQLLEDLMEEALGSRPPKRRKIMPEDDNNNNFFSGSFAHCGSSNNLSSLQDLKPKEEESLQINMMQYEDIAKLLDWGNESGGEISNGQSSDLTTEDNLVLDDHQIAFLFPGDGDDNNNTNKNPTLSSCSWENLPGFC